MVVPVNQLAKVLEEHGIESSVVWSIVDDLLEVYEKNVRKEVED